MAFLFLAVAFRFFWIQVVEGDALRSRAFGQWTREIPVTAARGEIYDANGVLLADNAAAYAVYARPNAVKDKRRAAEVLAGLFGLDEAELYSRLLSAKASELTIARRADRLLVEQLEGSGLTGVYYARDNVRIYPHGDALSRVIGFTSSDGAGLTGLEKYYDKYLAGKNGEIAYPADLIGKEVEGEVLYVPAADGLDLRLTVDFSIQAAAEAAMQRVYAQYSPVTAQCIVLDPNSGAVLAMAEYPGTTSTTSPGRTRNCSIPFPATTSFPTSTSPDPPSRSSRRRRTSKSICAATPPPFRRSMCSTAAAPAV